MNLPTANAPSKFKLDNVLDGELFIYINAEYFLL